jgi:hypothetical protein
MPVFDPVGLVGVLAEPFLPVGLVVGIVIRDIHDKFCQGENGDFP